MSDRAAPPETAPDAAPADPGRGGGRGGPRRIEVLASLVADQIAAGEVVERPASVVKELVENALDAGAREIEIELRDGGRESISVRDDGVGMDPEDAHRACLRHATSKLRTLEDLARLASHGFRGEALASIAAVAEVTIVTRPSSAEAGVRIVVADGEVRESEPTGAPVGTTVTVRRLFANVPARRKFLRSPQTETSHIVEMLSRLALARPEVGVACTQGGRDLLRHPAVSRPDERLRQVLGPARAKVMLAVARQEPGVAVRGWVSRAGESFAHGRGVLTFVNGRLVRDKVLIRAILDAYRALLPQGRHPAAVLHVDLPGDALDVNVHPAKTEVRFADGDAVYGALVRAIRSALAAGAVAPGAPPAAGGEGRDAPRMPAGGGLAASAAAGAGGTAGMPPSSPVPRDGRAARVGERVAEALSRYADREAAGTVGGGASRQPALGLRRGVAPADSGVEAARSHGAPGRGVEKMDGVSIPDAATESPAATRFADLRVIGQAFQGYIVCEAADALVLVDQHAAHERVRFERLRAAAAGSRSGTPSQRLLVPRAVELGEAACGRLCAIPEELAAAGFEIEPFGERSVLVRAMPEALDVATDVEVLLADLSRDLGAVGTDERLATARDALLARIACHGAVRSGDPLLIPEMNRILSDLDTIPFAATCPHGRPLLLEVPRAELARRVRRA